MTWREQAESMTKVWTEAQRAMWQGWYDAVQAASSPAMFNPGIVDEWRKMANQGMEMWTSNIDPAFKNVSNQLLGSQAAMMQMLQFTTEAWQSMAPKLEAGQDWSTVMNTYVEQMRQQLFPSAKGMMQSTQDASQLWQMYMGQLQQFSQPWSNVLQQAPGLLTGAMSGNGGNLVELTRLSWDAFGKTFGTFDQSPAFGLTRELEQKISEGFVAWKEFQEASNEYNILMSDAWSKVFAKVLQDMKDRADQDKPVESLNDLTRLWLSAADRSFDEMFRTDTYAQVQGRYVASYMNYRIHEQKIVEEMLKYSYIPTRSEVDEAHRNIHNLRKEVRMLKKSLAAQDSKSKGSRSKAKAAEGGE